METKHTEISWESYELECFNDGNGRTQAQQLREDGGSFRLGCGLPAIGIIQSADPFRKICTIDPHYSGDRNIEMEEYSANLISAAPDMYEALKNLTRGQLQTPTFEGYVKHAVAVAESAILKAEGGE